MKELGLHVLLVPKGNEIPRWRLMLTQSLIFFPLNLKLRYFLVMEIPLVLKRSQKSFDFLGFGIQPFTKHVFQLITPNSWCQNPEKALY